MVEGLWGIHKYSELVRKRAGELDNVLICGLCRHLDFYNTRMARAN